MQSRSEAKALLMDWVRRRSFLLLPGTMDPPTVDELADEFCEFDETWPLLAEEDAFLFSPALGRVARLGTAEAKDAPKGSVVW